MIFNFTGKTAVITGGGQGLGRAIAEALLRAGARVWLAECDVEAGVESCTALAPLGPVEFVPTDVADPAAVEALRAQLAAAGGLDLLVNNAAVMVRKPLAELSVAEWQRVLDVNLTGPFLCCRALAPLLHERRGNIVNIASTRALMSEPHTESYAAAKGGLVALTHALAMSLGGGAGQQHLAGVDRRLRFEQTFPLPTIPIERSRPCPASCRARRPTRGRRRDGSLPGLGRGRLHHRAELRSRRRDDQEDDLRRRPVTRG